MLINLLQVISCALGIYQSRTENKRNIYVTVFLFNFSCLLVYCILREWSTVLSYVLITIRSYVYIHKDRFLGQYIIPISFILLHIVAGIMTITSPWQILSVAAPAITCFYMWYARNTQQLRLGNITAAVIWLVYNLHCGLYILCINRTITIISNLMAYMQKRKLLINNTD